MIAAVREPEVGMPPRLPTCALGPIDHSRPFLPDSFTPLFHTALFSTLPDPVRLRYNQLHALYFNEQITFFERDALIPMLRALLAMEVPPGLRERLATVLVEEESHARLFSELNRWTAPGLYATTDQVFISPSSAMLGLLHAMAGCPSWFPLFAWMTLLQEERALYYSKGILEDGARLEPNFLAAHRYHLADEASHLAIDEALLDWLWPRVSRPLRRVNIRLLAWMLREFFLLPKRGGRRVVEQLAREFPSLDKKALRDAMAGLKDNTAFQEGLYSREITPRCFRRFDTEPGFEILSSALPGYRPMRHV